MTGARRIGLVAAAGNPLALAWKLFVERSTGASVVLLDTRRAGPTGHHAGFEQEWQGPRLALADLGRADTTGFDAFVVWWGYKALAHVPLLYSEAPGVPVYLVVDTLPDASWVGAELRELLAYRRGPQLAGVITSSSAMGRDLRRFCRAPQCVVRSVFPDEAFLPVSPAPESVEPAMSFSGRTDFAFSTDRRMSKDAIGPELQAIQASGLRVDVSALSSPVRGSFGQLPLFTNAEILGGVAANTLAPYAGQVVLYHVANRTIRRRVRNGLSTRLALALTNPSPIVIEARSAELLRELWGTRPWGLSLTDYLKEPDRFLLRQGEFRENWSGARPGLLSSAYHERFRDLLRSHA